MKIENGRLVKYHWDKIQHCDLLSVASDTLGIRVSQRDPQLQSGGPHPSDTMKLLLMELL